MKRSTYIMGTMIMAGVVLIASVFAFVRCNGEEIMPIQGVYLSEESEVYDLPKFDSVNFDLRYVYNEDAVGEPYYDGKLLITFVGDDSIAKPSMVVPKELIDSKNFVLDSTALSITIDTTSPYMLNVAESGGIKILIPRDINVNNINLPSCDLKLVNIDCDNMAVMCSAYKEQNLTIENCSIRKFVCSNFCGIEFSDFRSDDVQVWGARETRINARDSVDIKHLELAAGGYVDFILDGIEQYEAKPVDGATIGVKRLYESDN